MSYGDRFMALWVISCSTSKSSIFYAMRDIELYRQILGIEAPWYVKHVELDLEAGEVRVPNRPTVNSDRRSTFSP